MYIYTRLCSTRIVCNMIFTNFSRINRFLKQHNHTSGGISQVITTYVFYVNVTSSNHFINMIFYCDFQRVKNKLVISSDLPKLLLTLNIYYRYIYIHICIHVQVIGVRTLFSFSFLKKLNFFDLLPHL